MSGQVGEFPGMAVHQRRLIRAPVNPLDKSTVVSILPKKISERKFTIQPGIFEIEPGTPDKPAVLVVGPSSWWREVDDSQPMLEIPVSSIQVADSIVRDYCVGLLACNMEDMKPGIFYIPGEWNVERIKKEHILILQSEERKQRKWLAELIRIADILWARSQGNPLSISEDARLACKILNIQNKPWQGDQVAMELVRCVACGALRNPLFPICGTCKAIVDKDLAKKLDLTFAQ